MPIANVDKSIARNSHGVYDSELRWWWSSRIILAGAVLVLHCPVEGTRKALSRVLKIRIVGFASIRTPVTPVDARLRVKDDDSMIQISIRDVEIVFLLIDDEPCRTADIFRIIASSVFSTVADLHQEFPIVSEFQDLVIPRSRSCKPHVVLRINIDSVLKVRPLIAISRTSPGRDKVSLGIEFKDRRRSAI